MPNSFIYPRFHNCTENSSLASCWWVRLITPANMIVLFIECGHFSWNLRYQSASCSLDFSRTPVSCSGSVLPLEIRIFKFWAQSCKDVRINQESWCVFCLFILFCFPLSGTGTVLGFWTFALKCIAHTGWKWLSVFSRYYPQATALKQLFHHSVWQLLGSGVYHMICGTHSQGPISIAFLV